MMCLYIALIYKYQGQYFLSESYFASTVNAFYCLPVQMYRTARSASENPEAYTALITPPHNFNMFCLVLCVYYDCEQCDHFCKSETKVTSSFLQIQLFTWKLICRFSCFRGANLVKKTWPSTRSFLSVITAQHWITSCITCCMKSFHIPLLNILQMSECWSRELGKWHGTVTVIKGRDYFCKTVSIFFLP